MNPTDFEHVQFDPEEFSGTVRMFPIPNVVMFPHVVQALHVFEERYREMMHDALAGDHLIAMPVLKPGWEAEYVGRPPVEPWACLGKVVLHNKLADGCYNLLLMGVARLRIEQELAPVRSFRQARAHIVDDVCPGTPGEVAGLHDRLVAALHACIARGDAERSLSKMLLSDLSLPQLTDLLSYALPLSSDDKLTLLG